MGKRYVQHSDLCGCERCAVQADRENPAPVFDEVEDPNVLDCGCDAFRGCDCLAYDHDEDLDVDDDDGADECGRWRNGKLDPQCLKAGSEECDWECPIGLSRRTWP